MATEVFNKSMGIKHSFSATLENVDKIAEKIEIFLRKIGIKDQFFDIILGMREGLVNAVVHGSAEDREKKVAFSLRLEGYNLIIEVEDEGAGFDLRSCFGKNMPSKEESGRGLAIMKRMFTLIKYNEKGNKLILEKRI